MPKLNTAQNGKGSAPRKGADPKAYREGWDRIFNKGRDAKEFAEQVIAVMQKLENQSYPGVTLL